MHAAERTALVTGASRGLGLALARGLAGRGWNLILTARDAARLSDVRDELARQTHVAAIAGDVTDAAHRAALAVLARGHAGLDAIVNNAGALGPSPLPPLVEYPLDALRSVLDTNVIAPLGMLQAVRDVLKPGARVLSITSDAAINAYAGWGAYGASKAALLHLSRIWDEELREHGVRVIAVDPGDMDTPLHARALPDADPAALKRPDDAAREIVDLIATHVAAAEVNA